MLQVSLKREEERNVSPSSPSLPLTHTHIPCQWQLQFQLFFSAARPFIPSFFSSVCLPARSCVFMRSAKAINIVIIATLTSPVCQAIQHSPFSIHRLPFTIRRHFALCCPTDSFCGSFSLHRCLILAILSLSLYRIAGCPVLVASCRLNDFHPQTLPRG